MSSCDASSRDLATARTLSRRLAEGEAEPERVAGVAPPDPGDYVRLRAVPRAAPAAPAAAPRPVPTLPAPPPGLPADELWGPLLDWCRAAARAESAFLVGPEGLLMECRGALSLDEAQTLGGTLRGLLAKARSLASGEDAPRLSLVVERTGSVLTGFSPVLANGDVVTIGFVGKEPVPAPLRDEVFRGLSRI